MGPLRQSISSVYGHRESRRLTFKTVFDILTFLVEVVRSRCRRPQNSVNTLQAVLRLTPSNKPLTFDPLAYCRLTVRRLRRQGQKASADDLRRWGPFIDQHQGRHQSTRRLKTQDSQDSNSVGCGLKESDVQVSRRP